MQHVTSKFGRRRLLGCGFWFPFRPCPLGAMRDWRCRGGRTARVKAAARVRRQTRSRCTRCRRPGMRNKAAQNRMTPDAATRRDIIASLWRRKGCTDHTEIDWERGEDTLILCLFFQGSLQVSSSQDTLIDRPRDPRDLPPLLSPIQRNFVHVGIYAQSLNSSAHTACSTTITPWIHVSPGAMIYTWTLSGESSPR